MQKVWVVGLSWLYNTVIYICLVCFFYIESILYIITIAMRQKLTVVLWYCLCYMTKQFHFSKISTQLKINQIIMLHSQWPTPKPYWSTNLNSIIFNALAFIEHVVPTSEPWNILQIVLQLYQTSLAIAVVQATMLKMKIYILSKIIVSWNHQTKTGKAFKITLKSGIWISYHVMWYRS